MKDRLFSFISLLIFAVSCFSHTHADEKTIYLSQDDKSHEQVVGYSKTTQGLNRYLAYRDIPPFITQYCHGKESLDYGAGTGISTQFLQEQSLNVTGVDISKEMLGSSHCYLSEYDFSPDPKRIYPLEI